MFACPGSVFDFLWFGCVLVSLLSMAAPAEWVLIELVYVAIGFEKVSRLVEICAHFLTCRPWKSVHFRNTDCALKLGSRWLGTFEPFFRLEPAFKHDACETWKVCWKFYVTQSLA